MQNKTFNLKVLKEKVKDEILALSNKKNWITIFNLIREKNSTEILKIANKKRWTITSIVAIFILIKIIIPTPTVYVERGQKVFTDSKTLQKFYNSHLNRPIGQSTTDNYTILASMFVEKSSSRGTVKSSDYDLVDTYTGKHYRNKNNDKDNLVINNSIMNGTGATIVVNAAFDVPSNTHFNYCALEYNGKKHYVFNFQ